MTALTTATSGTDLSAVDAELTAYRNTIAMMLARIASVSNGDQMREINDQIKLAKAWARIHKQTKHLRLDLLRLEIAALVRTWELGGSGLLTASEVEAAEKLAKLTPTQINRLILNYGNVTTAAGLVRAWLHRDESVKKYDKEVQGWVAAFTSNDSYANGVLPARQMSTSEYYTKAASTCISSRMDSVMEAIGSTGEPYTIQEIAEEIIEGVGRDVDWTHDSAMTDGLKEVIRKSIRSHPVTIWEGIDVPKTITSVIPDGTPRSQRGATTDHELAKLARYVRIPVQNAKVSDLETMIALREEQLKQDSDALDRLREFHSRLMACDGVTPQSNIGSLIEQTRKEAAA